MRSARTPARTAVRPKNWKLYAAGGAALAALLGVAPGATGAPNSAATRACGDTDVSITTSTYRQDEGRHLLITATNVSGSTCTLYHYPFVSFGEDVDTYAQPMESLPAAPARLKPHQHGYAGVRVFRDDDETRTVTTMAIAYQERVPNSHADPAPIEVPLPEDTDFLTVGPNPLVTYWNPSRRAVEDLLFRSPGS